MYIFLLFGQAPPVNFDPYSILTQIGIGALIAGPIFYLWRDERKQKQALEKYIIDRLGELVVGSTSALEEVKNGLEHTVDKIAEKSTRMDLDKALRRIEMVTDALKEERQDHND